MGIELVPISPHIDAPCDDEGHSLSLEYNAAEWQIFRFWLLRHGVDISEFTGYNDEGTVISENTCLKVAATIENNLSEFESVEPMTLENRLRFWKTCGGFRQW